MYSRILAATDFSGLGNAAATRAAMLSREQDSAVFFVHAMPSEVALRSIFRDVTDAFVEDFRAATHERAEQLAAQLRDIAHRPVAVECKAGAPHQVVAQVAQDDEVDMVVAGAHGQGALQQLFLGGTVSRLMATLACPLLLTRREPTGPYARVVAAVDLGPHSETVLAAAGGMTSETIQVLHAVKFPQAVRFATTEQSQALLESSNRALEADREASLGRLIASRPDAGRYQASQVAGHPTTVILESLEAHSADLLVIGRHAGSRLAERFMGSVPKFLAYHAPCDLLLV